MGCVVTVFTGLTLPQGGAHVHVYIRITMVTTSAHASPCGKVSPANIAKGGHRDRARKTSNFPVLVEFPLLVYLIQIILERCTLHRNNQLIGSSLISFPTGNREVYFRQNGLQRTSYFRISCTLIFTTLWSCSHLMLYQAYKQSTAETNSF